MIGVNEKSLNDFENFNINDWGHSYSIKIRFIWHFILKV